MHQHIQAKLLLKSDGIRNLLADKAVIPLLIPHAFAPFEPGLAHLSRLREAADGRRRQKRQLPLLALHLQPLCIRQAAAVWKLLKRADLLRYILAPAFRQRAEDRQRLTAFSQCCCIAVLLFPGCGGD
ncbi:hypothetical protein D3C81_1559940 [compost metagenome]